MLTVNHQITKIPNEWACMTPHAFITGTRSRESSGGSSAKTFVIQFVYSPPNPNNTPITELHHCRRVNTSCHASNRSKSSSNHGAPAETRDSREPILQCWRTGPVGSTRRRCRQTLTWSQEDGHYTDRPGCLRRTRPGAHFGHLLVAGEVPS
jgi:hypothetical protein